MQELKSPKISILMITYRQEDIVSRSLDSLLKQKDYIYEICINDDCSPDGTWEVLCKYANDYPHLIKPVRNNHNVGIFENTELSWKRPEGDIIFQIAGDDEVSDGYFKEIVRFMNERNLDGNSEKFCIYGDDVQITPNGNRIVYSNSIIQSGKDPIKLKLRELISGRGICFSKALLDSFIPVSNGRDYSVEIVQDCQPHLFASNNYYIPHLSSIYNSGIGVSTTMNCQVQYEHLKKGYDLLDTFLKEYNCKLDWRDRQYEKFRLSYLQWCQRKSIRNTFRMLFTYLFSIDFSLGFKGLQLDRILFVLRKKKR